MKLNLLLISLNCFLAFQSLSCSFNGNEVFSGTLSPTTGYQTVNNITNGNYYSVNVTCGNTYNFNFCNNGGSASWDTQITILATDGSTELAYNDDNCGTQSNISWTSNFTGVVYVLINEWSCDFDRSQSSATLAYNMSVGSPDFTLDEICGGGSATVTGTTGGTFTFNPLPGDGAQINAVTGAVSNGTAGTTYFIEYSVCLSSSIESVTVLNDDCFTLNGNAQYIDISGEDCIQLTSETNSITGCAWSGSQIDFNSNFSLTLDYYFGDNINGADGNTFTFQPSSSTACGQDGSQLGAGGIPNALVVEFDTYDNDSPSHVYDMACDHIAVEIDGNLQNNAPYCGPVCAKSGGGNIDDGGTYEVEIAWNASAQDLEIYFNGSLRLTCNGDFVNTVFGGQNLAYWGATSATGGLNNQQYFCPSTVIILPTDLGSFTSSCKNDLELIEWTSLSENRVAYFQLEYTYDGMIFYPLDKVKAVGNSNTPIQYKVEHKNNDSKQRYYRLKIIDENGDLNYTDLIVSQKCEDKKTNSIISKITQFESILKVECFEDASLKIINQLGEIVFKSNEIKSSFMYDIKAVSTGVFYIIADNNEGIIDSKKILITD